METSQGQPWRSTTSPGIAEEAAPTALANIEAEAPFLERPLDDFTRPEWLENCRHDVTPIGRSYRFGDLVTAYLDDILCRTNATEKTASP